MTRTISSVGLDRFGEYALIPFSTIGDPLSDHGIGHD